jgi:phosphoglycolate phosphatase-like HAD superfamily hydrolase
MPADGRGSRAYFEVVAGPAADLAMEPKATTLRAALDALDEPRAVMIGDRSHDIARARQRAPGNRRPLGDRRRGRAGRC